jgi:hypothetical protein
MSPDRRSNSKDCLPECYLKNGFHIFARREKKETVGIFMGKSRRNSYFHKKPSSPLFDARFRNMVFLSLQFWTSRIEKESIQAVLIIGVSAAMNVRREFERVHNISQKVNTKVEKGQKLWNGREPHRTGSETVSLGILEISHRISSNASLVRFFIESRPDIERNNQRHSHF